MERQWGTVREDYSENGGAWNYFTHDQARSRATQREAGVSSAPRAAPLTRAITVDGDAVSFGAFQHCSLRDRRSTRRAHPPFQLSPGFGRTQSARRRIAASASRAVPVQDDLMTLLDQEPGRHPVRADSAARGDAT